MLSRWQSGMLTQWGPSFSAAPAQQTPCRLVTLGPRRCICGPQQSLLRIPSPLAVTGKHMHHHLLPTEH